MQFPRFNEARGATASMQLTPPFQFTGVTMRVFPLRANRYLLQRFIDGQLNIIPPEAGQFSVFLPYVYLIIVNYGKMAVEAANLGWISQNEVAFSVPLIWKRKVGGELVQDFAYISPFIYVDNPLSMTTGREVYGWPKMMASFDPQMSSWMANPTNRIQQAAMSVDMVRQAYSGARSARCTLLEVDAAPFPSFAQMPFDVRNPVMPWNATRKAVYTSAALFGDSVEIMRGMLEEFVLGEGREGLAGQLRRAIQSPASLAVLNTVNLKQFRDAEQPDLLAYQAVTNTPMTIRSFRRGGMLGDLRVLSGDATGGYRIRIHNYDTQPIIASLGLEVASTSEIEGTNVANLQPVYPYWIEVDLDYPLAQILAWRQKGSHRWFYGDAQSKTEINENYNTVRGAGGQEIAGPFSFPDATVRVLPLLADQAKLQAFIDAYLNTTLAETSSRFEAWGRYVYVVVLSDESAFSESNNVGNNATRQLSVLVPVKHYEKTAKGERMISTALVPVYAYANAATAAISISSVNGIPTMTAELESPANNWLDRRGPSPAAIDEFMRLRGEVLPVLGLGQQAQTRTIVECNNVEPVEWDDLQGWTRLGDRWAPTIKRENERKREVSPERLRDAKTLALELLANGASFNFLTLKQFRSAADPCEACYQALVEIPNRIEQLFELEEIESSLHLRVHEYPSQAIISTLGIVVKDWQRGNGSRVAVLEPCRPFWFRARMRQELGTNIHVWMPTRAGVSNWSDAPARDTLLTTGPKLGPTLVDEIEDSAPQYLAGQTTRWLDGGGVPLEIERAQMAVESVEPQQVIESVLSCEWEAWLNPRWYRGHNEIITRIEDATAGSYPSEVTSKTGKVLEHVRERTHDHVHRPFGFAAHRFRSIDDDFLSYHALAERFALVQESEEHLRAFDLIEDDANTDSTGCAKQQALQKRLEADEALLRHLDEIRQHAEALAEQVVQQSDPTAPLPFPQPPLLVGGSDAFTQVWAALDQIADVGDHKHDPVRDGPISDEDRRQLIAEIKTALDNLRNRMIKKLAKSWQKPDNCIRRQTILRDGVSRHFPSAESFDEHWYVGQPLAEVEATDE